jgi:large subunit ribosomal protein L23
MKLATVKPQSLSVFDVIRAPVITEKSTVAGENNQYTFKVANDSTKQDIKIAVETLYKVKVEKVNTLNLKGKVKRFKGRLGKRNDVKKAIVRLASGQKIDLSSGL